MLLVEVGEGGAVKASFEEVVAVLRKVVVALVQDETHVILHQVQIYLAGSGNVHAGPCIGAHGYATVRRIWDHP